MDPVQPVAPDASEVADWALDGRFFTVDTAGVVTSWSPLAIETFGWKRNDAIGMSFVDALIAPESQAGQAELLARGGFTGDVIALAAEERSVQAAFALVPIKLGAGYEFNSLLQEILTRGRDAGAVTEVHARREKVESLVAGALEGTGTEDVAGTLVVFRAGPASGGGSGSGDGTPDNVVSISTAGLEEARIQLEKTRREAEEGRIEIRSLEGQLEEARREAQRSRNEADIARQEQSDARDLLIVAQRETEEARRQLEDARRMTDEVRATAEAARIRSEEARGEADSLRAQLREARDSVRGIAGRTDGELAQAQERAAHAERALAEARAEVARHEAEVAPLRERYQTAQRELGALRADLESARAAAAELEAVGERRAGELERLRAELDGRGGEVERLRAAFEQAPSATALIATDGRYLEVSDALCEALRQPRERLLSPQPPAVVHPEDAAARNELFRRMLAGDPTPARAERRYLDANGHAIQMRESASLVRDRQGRPEMFVVQIEEAEATHQDVVVDAEVASDEVIAAEVIPPEALRDALENDLFQLHCQPVLDLRTNSVTQYELLIRMVGEGGRMILPQAFLEPARRAGLAHAIDRWVVRKAIRLLNETAPEVSLEVNLSPEAVHDPDLPVLIDQELAATTIDPARLVLEVTGATAADHIEETRELAKRLRGLGCRFALDDFRSNFGSFRLLRDLPLDYLKLDGELVGSLTESRTSQLIVKALVDVAAGTGMKTVAVFVSDDATLGLLRQTGVDYAQGYTVGRPRAVEDVLQTAQARQLPSGL